MSSGYPKLVVLTNQFPCERAVGQLATYLAGSVTYHSSLKTTECKSLVAVLSATKDHVDHGEGQEIVMIGTYWTAILPELLKAWPAAHFSIYALAAPSSLPLDKDKITIVYDEKNNSGPMEWMVNLILSRELASNAFIKLFTSTSKEWMKKVDDRNQLRNQESTQLFFTGLMNMEVDPKLTDQDKWQALFENKYRFEKIMQKGSTIITSQMNVVRSTIANNSRVVGVNINGKKRKMMVASNTVFTTLTHQLILEDQKDKKEVDLSMVVYTTISHNGDSTGISVRRINPEVSELKVIMEKLGGGGSEQGGGASFTNTFIPEVIEKMQAASAQISSSRSPSKDEEMESQ